MDIPIAQQNINFPGYGMFWVANSISSTVLGWNNRRLQEKAHEKNQEFQLEMERARNITEDKRLLEDIAFKRRLIALSREYRQKEALRSFEEQMKAVELKTFFQRNWPLDQQLPYILLEESTQSPSSTSRLNVVLMRTPLLPLKKYGGANDLDEEIYNGLEYSIAKDDVPSIGNIKYRKGACPKVILKSGNANIMNIHFLMSQLPTLIISPQYINGKIYFNGSIWEAQAARPLTRSLFNFDFSPFGALESDEYRKLMIEKMHASISIIAGVVRDHYMLLTQGATPTMTQWLNDDKHSRMRELLNENLNIKQFVQQENNKTLEALDEKNSPRLFEVFIKEDINRLKKQIPSIQKDK